MSRFKTYKNVISTIMECLTKFLNNIEDFNQTASGAVWCCSSSNIFILSIRTAIPALHE